jgi:23S rRNA (uracil1939-C5)-methyltransferase
MMRLTLEALQDEFPSVASLERVIDGRHFRFNPLSFTQANESLMPELYEKAKRAMKGRPQGRVLDLFAGVGILGIICCGDYGVDFVERSSSAVEDLKRNVVTNKVPDAVILEGDAESLLDEAIEEKDYAWVIMNPPRKGLPRRIPEVLCKSAINNLLYVSCNPATLGRDIGRLKEGGFGVDFAEGVDMFPRTPHVETVAVISR